ncbi:Hypothetical predicted protein, partial [Marmota monax]
DARFLLLEPPGAVEGKEIPAPQTPEPQELDAAQKTTVTGSNFQKLLCDPQ